MLAHVIGQARQVLEGSLEGDYLSEINDFGLVEDLKTQYLVNSYYISSNLLSFRKY